MLGDERPATRRGAESSVEDALPELMVRIGAVDQDHVERARQATSARRSQTPASVLTICARSASCVRARLAAIARAAVASRSTKVACAAPRDRASIPAAPLPANRSRNLEPGRSGSRIAKSVCLTRSPSGRVPSPGASSRRPRALPAMTRPASAIRAPRHHAARRFGGGDSPQPARFELGLQGRLRRDHPAIRVEEPLRVGAGPDGQVAVGRHLE